MKKMQGVVDPISLTLVLVLGIAALGTIAGNKTEEQQQLAQNVQAEQSETILADN